MNERDEYGRGTRDGTRWAIAWLHKRAEQMNDPHAKAILNTAAFQMGVEAKTTAFVPLSDTNRGETG